MTFDIGSLTLSVVDIIIFAICMISAVVCCFRGAVKTLFMYFSVAGGFLTGLMFTTTLLPRVAEIMPESFPLWLVSLITFVGLSLVGCLVFLILGSLCDKFIDVVNLEWLNHIIGFVAGLVLALAAVSLVVWLLSVQPVFDLSEVLSSSVLYTRLIEPMLPSIASSLGDFVTEGLSDLA